MSSENFTSAAGTTLQSFRGKPCETILYMSRFLLDPVDKHHKLAVSGLPGAHVEVLGHGKPVSQALGGVSLCRVTADADVHARLRRDIRNLPLSQAIGEALLNGEPMTIIFRDEPSGQILGTTVRRKKQSSTLFPQPANNVAGE